MNHENNFFSNTDLKIRLSDKIKSGISTEVSNYKVYDKFILLHNIKLEKNWSKQ